MFKNSLCDNTIQNKIEILKYNVQIDNISVIR